MKRESELPFVAVLQTFRNRPNGAGHGMVASIFINIMIFGQYSCRNGFFPHFEDAISTCLVWSIFVHELILDSMEMLLQIVKCIFVWDLFWHHAVFISKIILNQTSTLRQVALVEFFKTILFVFNHTIFAENCCCCLLSFKL